MKRLIPLLFCLCLSFTAKAAPTPELATWNEQKLKITVSAKQPEFTLKLKSNPTTGYTWFLKKYNSSYLKLDTHRFQAAKNKKLMGAPGFELWTFTVKPAAFKIPLRTALHFVYARPWEKNKQGTELTFWVSTKG